VTRNRFHRLLLLATLAAALHGLALVVTASRHLPSDSVTYLAEAHALLHGSYSTPTQGLGVLAPDLSRTPGYPLLLAAAGGGGAGWSRGLVYAYQLLLLAATVWIAGLLFRRLWGPSVALLAVFLYALDPFSKRYAALILTENLVTFMVVATAYAFTRAAQERSAWWWTASGLLSGAAILVRPAFAIAVPLGVVASFVLAKSPRRLRLEAAGAFLVGALLVLSPWLIRNTTVVGKPVLASWGAGESVLFGAYGEGYKRPVNVILTDPGFAHDFRDMSYPGFYPPKAELVRHPDLRARTEIAVDSQLRKQGRHVYRTRLTSDPAAVLGPYAYRVYFLWAAHDDLDQPQYRGLRLLALELVVWTSLLLAVAGAVLALRRRGPGAGLVAFMVVYTLSAALVHVEPRYSIPLRPLFFGLVGLALVEAYRRWSPAARRARS